MLAFTDRSAFSFVAIYACFIQNCWRREVFMQNFTTASLKGHRDIEEQILRLQNYINGSRYTVAITGAGISMAAGIMDFAHMNFPLVLQMSSSAVLKSAPNHYYNTARKAFLDAMFENGPSVAHKKLAEYFFPSCPMIMERSSA